MQKTITIDTVATQTYVCYVRMYIYSGMGALAWNSVSLYYLLYVHGLAIPT